MVKSSKRKGVAIMAHAMINFRTDEDLKRSMEEIYRGLGLSMTTIFTIFAKNDKRKKNFV